MKNSKLKITKWYYIQLFFVIIICISFLISPKIFNAGTELIFGNYIFPLTSMIFVIISILLNDNDEVFGILYLIYAVVFYSYFGNDKVIYLLFLALMPIFCIIRMYQLYKRKHPYRLYLIPALFIMFVYFYLTSLFY